MYWHVLLKRGHLSEVCKSSIIFALATVIGTAALAAEVANPSVAYIQRTMTRIPSLRPVT